MDLKNTNRVLETKPATLKFVRKEYNLDKPGQMEEAVKILRDWVQKQKHFKKKDFNDTFYELSIIGCKGSIERAKTQIDKLCTLRTLLPEFFKKYNLKTEFGNLNEIAYFFLLPKLTNDYYRIEVVKIFENLKASQFIEFYRANTILAEYIKMNDYLMGYIVIVDFTEINLLENLTRLNPIELRQAMSIFIEGYGMRIKGVHIITTSTAIETLMTIIKQVVSSKIAAKVHVHKTIEGVYEHVPKSLLPKDYGGEQRSLKELHAEWIEALSSEKHIKHMQEMSKAVTDENLRQKDKFNEQYAGMPGTFRLLSVD